MKADVHYIYHKTPVDLDIFMGRPGIVLFPTQAHQPTSKAKGIGIAFDSKEVATVYREYIDRIIEWFDRNDVKD